ncbi:Acetylglucosaminyltransferase EXT1/exostosin 1 [Handroanthus impetiginosus]|uniref:Acetylglucosaminyltransferase EXT1/exostosin 1 n=1 Tax=Handroanthus impetiginosus TaxID=429701 RepID=A0A2G9HHZ0_9LAMI|nr:Acetylglucosaminyltransferase EXT1/exostosin 1 [Handroanthus impetiginosus]
MVPASPEAQTMKKPPKSTNFLKNTVNLIRIHISTHPRFWLFITFLWVQGLIISIARTPPACFPERTAPVPVAAAVSAVVPIPYLPPHDAAVPNATKTETPPARYTEECPSGRIYAYDLPSTFNKDLVLPNCTDLDRWNWECGIISNHGYGRAAAELRRILPEDLHKSWYRTNQYTLEILFHHRILKHKCRTLEPESATAFYIPFYAGLAVGKHLWMNDTAARDRHCKMMLRWVRNQTYWKKSNGSDHFMTIGRITWDFRRLTDPGRSWGSSFLNMPLMQKVSRFIIEKYPGDEMDVSVPYPTGFHPKTKDNIIEWQNFIRDYNRSTLFTFIGDTRNWADNDFRRFLMNYCQKESGSCRPVDCAASECSTDLSVILSPLLGSEFCLQPKGDSFTSRAVFDCMLAGSIPVFFTKTAYEQYEWFFPGEPESYSVFINQEEVRNGTASVKQILTRYSKEEIKWKREKVIETIPRITYAKPNGGIKSFKDAFDIALDGVLERIKEEKEWADFL